jgi:hypothetical protein
MEVTLMADFSELAKKKLEELKGKRDKLLNELAELDKEFKPLEAYLMAIGALELPVKQKRRGRKPKEKA